jgi:DNA invertase Pin-like site-specific DNA recombinase
MGLKRGYIRVWKDGPTEKEQRDALRNACVEVDGIGAKVYFDNPKPSKMRLGSVALTDRAQCIFDMRSRPAGETPDELVVYSMWVLALSAIDLFSIAAQLTKTGAIIHDLNTGKRMHWTPEMAALAEAAASIQKYQGARKTEKARITLAASDVKVGPKHKLTGRLFDLFLQDWSDPKAGTNEQVARRHGISVTTAHRVAGMSRVEAIRRADRARHDQNL